VPSACQTGGMGRHKNKSVQNEERGLTFVQGLRDVNRRFKRDQEQGEGTEPGQTALAEVQAKVME